MDTSIYSQINNLIQKSQRILLLTHAKADCDGLGSALTMQAVLKDLGKEVVVATNDPAAENMMFLPNIDLVENSLAGVSDFVIRIDTSNVPIGKIRYNAEDNSMNIIVSPKNGHFKPENVSFQQGENKFDLIIVFDTGNLEHLGGIYDRNVQMFFETPVINIDHHASNTDYGQVNLVDVTAASTTEVLFEFLMDLEKKLERKLISEDMATLLLAGLITDTGSFQHANTSPRSMETAAKLLDLGARQQEIIKNIYKTKKLSTLKLWGIILSKVQVDPVHRMVWSTISEEDLKEADATSEETEGIIDDLLNNAPGVEVVFLIKWNEEGYTSISMRSTTNQADVGKFCAQNGGGGHVRAAGFKVRDGRPFDQIVSEVTSKVRQYQAERLNILPPMTNPAPVTPPEAPVQQPATPVQQPTQMTEPMPAQPAPQANEPAAQPTQETYLEFKAPTAPEVTPAVPVETPATPMAAEVPAPEIVPAAAPQEQIEDVQPKKRRRRRRRRSSRGPGMPPNVERGPGGRFVKKADNGASDNGQTMTPPATEPMTYPTQQQNPNPQPPQPPATPPEPPVV